MHAKRCLAEAIISAVQNARDEHISDFDFFIRSQDEGFHRVALGYLEDGLQTCTCSHFEDEEKRAIVLELLNDPTYTGIVSGEYALETLRGMRDRHRERQAQAVRVDPTDPDGW